MRSSRIMKMAALMAAVMMIMVFAAGCGGSDTYADGTYTGKSEVYESDGSDDAAGGDGYGEVTITIKDGVITECDFEVYEPDGTLKDEDYGKQNGEIANQDFYNKAQKGLAGAKEYAKMLVESGDYHSIDAISGATVSYNQFMEAVDNALADAKE